MHAELFLYSFSSFLSTNSPTFGGVLKVCLKISACRVACREVDWY